MLLKGYKHTEETKRKISDALKGRMPKNLAFINANKNGSGNPMWGKHSSKKQKEAVRKMATGRIKSLEEIEKIRYANSNERAKNWKGDDASYSSIHKWIRKEYGNAKNFKCNFCEKTSKDSRLCWSNKNHQYKRNRKDWIVLCWRCHKIYDLKFLKGIRKKV